MERKSLSTPTGGTAAQGTSAKGGHGSAIKSVSTDHSVSHDEPLKTPDTPVIQRMAEVEEVQVVTQRISHSSVADVADSGGKFFETEEDILAALIDAIKGCLASGKPQVIKCKNGNAAFQIMTIPREGKESAELRMSSVDVEEKLLLLSTCFPEGKRQDEIAYMPTVINPVKLDSMQNDLKVYVSRAVLSMTKIDPKRMFIVDKEAVQRNAESERAAKEKEEPAPVMEDEVRLGADFPEEINLLERVLGGLIDEVSANRSKNAATLVDVEGIKYELRVARVEASVKNSGGIEISLRSLESLGLPVIPVSFIPIFHPVDPRKVLFDLFRPFIIKRDEG